VIEPIVSIAGIVLGSARDVLPIVVFLFLFQRLVIGQPMPGGKQILAGFGLVVIGLALFLVGLEEALFPLGRHMAARLTEPAFLGPLASAGSGPEWLHYFWIYVFAFAVGISTTLAEPALIAVSLKANQVSGGTIDVWGLRVAVALGVGIGVSLGCFRIVTGLGLHYFIAAGYLIVIIQTAFAPRVIVPLAYDSGGVTTSTVTVPIITALGLGLGEAIEGRSPLLDGFGLVAFASLFPIVTVLAYGQISVFWERVNVSRRE
jgi:hypothetical protein